MYSRGVLAKEIHAGWSVLDVGCGTGDKVLAAPLLAGVQLHGVDGHAPSLAEAKAAGYASVACADLMEFLRDCPTGSFDCVISLDVVEHFTRQGGAELIEEMCRVAVHRVILLTPTGFVPQAPAPDNPHQEHLSGWWPRDLAEHGFQRFYGINGWKRLRGEYANPTVRPRALGLVLAEMSQPLTTHAPNLAYQFIAVRDLEASRGEKS
jgi:SAM-dependent methyltransferase